MLRRTFSSTSTINLLPSATFNIPFDTEQRQGTPPEYNEAVSSDNDRKHADAQGNARKQTRPNENTVEMESYKDPNAHPPRYIQKPDLERKREFSNITTDPV